MSRVRYGTTWWGAQWLQALAKIDYDNRLPRGRTYANNGSVTTLKQLDGHITAKVQGSRLYTVHITVPAFAPPETLRLMDALAADPIRRLLVQLRLLRILAVAQHQIREFVH